MNSMKPELRKKFAGAALAVTLVMAVTGSGFPSTVSAETSGQSASSNLAITHEGVTLSISKVMFDGNRLDMAFRQEGGTVGKGIIIDIAQIPVLSVNGKRMLYLPYVTSMPEDERAALLSFNIPKDGKPQLADEFKMTIEVYTKSVKEPFTFTVPVKKLNSLATLQPGTTQKNGDFSYTVDYFQMTPLMMELKLHSSGKVPGAAKSKGRSSKMLYDIADEKGNLIQATVSDIDIKRPITANIKEDLFYAASFKAVPKTITIRPFTYTIDAKGDILKDSGKKWIKTYYKDLEMKIAVAK